MGTNITMVNFFDYIFWRIYIFFKTHKLAKENEAMLATTLLFLFIGIPLGAAWGFLSSIGILLNIGDISSQPQIFTLSLTALLMSPLIYRYLCKKSIRKNDYEIFRKKWGNEPLPVRKRRKWLIIVLFIFNCIIIPIAPIVVTILSNRRFIILGHLIQW